MRHVVSTLPRGYTLPNVHKQYRGIPCPVSVLPSCSHPAGCGTRPLAGRHEDAERWFTFDAYACLAHLPWLRSTTERTT